MKRVFTSFGLHGRPVRGDPPARVGAGPRPAARKKIVDFAGEHGWPLFVKPARGGLVHRHHQGRRPRPASTRRSPRPSATTRRSSSRRCCAAARSSAACWSSRTARARRVPAEIPPVDRARLLRLRGQVHRLGRRASCPRRSPRSRPPRCSGSRSRPSRRRPARAWSARTSSSPRTASSSSTRSTRCPASPRSRCTRGCGRRRGVELPGAGGPADPGGAAPLHRACAEAPRAGGPGRLAVGDRRSGIAFLTAPARSIRARPPGRPRSFGHRHLDVRLPRGRW